MVVGRAFRPNPFSVSKSYKGDQSKNRVAITTLGCKVNTFESELIAKRLIADQFERVDAGSDADWHIINSCTVTAEADRQTRQIARRLKRQNPDAKIVITGCYAQTNPDACVAIEGIDWVVGNAAKLDIPVIVRDETAFEAPIIHPVLDELVALPSELLNGYESQSRAFIQIQQGCDQGCTFCIIHVARGPSRSFDPAAIVAQYQQLATAGYHEVVLCGVDLGSYGEDLADEVSLAVLLESMLQKNLDCRIRLSSIDPIHLTDLVIGLIAQNPRICSHVHLSMQSANTLVLKQMKRRASRDMIYERIAKLRRITPNLTLSADILVGFPTESLPQFEETLQAITDLGIAWPHVFPYSPREGTPAARIKKQVEKSERKRRAALARRAGERVRTDQAKQLVGTNLRCIVESVAPGSDYSQVRSDNYWLIRVEGVALPEGQWVDVTVTKTEADSIVGELSASS